MAWIMELISCDLENSAYTVMHKQCCLFISMQAMRHLARTYSDHGVAVWPLQPTIPMSLLVRMIASSFSAVLSLHTSFQICR